VSYEYQIGTFEVTCREYAAFLNSVAATDPNSLYDPAMNIDAVNGGIQRSGLGGSFSYKVKPGFDLRPANYVSYWDALRFVNWLSNGQPVGAQDSTTTEDGTYTLSLTPQAIVRNPGSRIFLASEDEWYKAAYYAGSSLYYDYPSNSDGKTHCDPPGLSSPLANCFYFATPLTTTNAGAYPSTQNPHGTSDQAGNVWEWLDNVRPYETRQRIGGSYSEAADVFNAHATPRSNLDPTTHSADLGFRITTLGPIPVIPTTSPIALGGLVALLVLAGAAYSARWVRDR
jgi:formylglycine-generating enzyme required for sulfatase activity